MTADELLEVCQVEFKKTRQQIDAGNKSLIAEMALLRQRVHNVEEAAAVFASNGATVVPEVKPWDEPRLRGELMSRLSRLQAAEAEYRAASCIVMREAQTMQQLREEIDDLAEDVASIKERLEPFETDEPV